MSKVATPAMKFDALQRHQDVLVRCLDCVREIKRLEGDCAFYDLRTWHWLEDTEFDHVHETADGGPHTVENLRPKCGGDHAKKTTRNEKLRHHLDRAGKKHRGTFVNPHHRPLPPGPGFDTRFSRKVNGTTVRRTS